MIKVTAAVAPRNILSIIVINLFVTAAIASPINVQKSPESWRTLIQRVILHGYTPDTGGKTLSHLTPNNPTKNHVARHINLATEVVMNEQGQPTVEMFMSALSEKNQQIEDSDVWTSEYWFFVATLDGNLISANKFTSLVKDGQTLGENEHMITEAEALKAWSEEREFWQRNQEVQKPRDYDPDKKYFKDEA